MVLKLTSRVRYVSQLNSRKKINHCAADTGRLNCVSWATLVSLFLKSCESISPSLSCYS